MEEEVSQDNVVADQANIFINRKKKGETPEKRKGRNPKMKKSKENFCFFDS